MKISKLLNKINLLIIIVLFFYSFFVTAEEQPVDIWNINKEKIESEIKKDSLNEISEVKIEESIYNKQNNNQIDPIELDSKLISKEVRIIGLYDPDEYGLDINMWLNSDGLILKNLFRNINNYKFAGQSIL